MIHIYLFKKIKSHIPFPTKIGLCIFILLSSAYITYPYLTLWFISQAIQDHDTAYLAKKLNWRAIQSELKKEMTNDFQEPPNHQDELPEFGNSFASTAINNAIDTHINKTSLHILVDYLSPISLHTNSVTQNMHEALQIFKSSHIRFISPLTLQTQFTLPDNKPLHITMKLQQGQWKITGINLPTSILTKIFEENSKH